MEDVVADYSGAACAGNFLRVKGFRHSLSFKTRLRRAKWS